MVSALTAESDLAEYVEYLRLRERGLRKDAFRHLAEFITLARSWNAIRQRDLVNRLMLLKHENPRVSDMIPDPLMRELFNPILDRWMASEPTNPVPCRWRGGKDNLRRAVWLDPNEQIARQLLANRLLHEVEFAAHELPAGYIGSAGEDINKLDEVESLLTCLSAGTPDEFLKRLSALRHKVESYLASTER
jgi:hypothetical protein